MRRWWDPDPSSLISCAIGLRPGGAWRYVTKEADGSELGWHGADAVATNTWTADERDGVTTLRVLVRHTTQEHRDGHVASGMETGMQLSLDHLEDLVAETAADRLT